jgi:hypothetical protein
MAKVRVQKYSTDFSGGSIPAGYSNGPGDFNTMAVSSGLLQRSSGDPFAAMFRTGESYTSDQYSSVVINNIAAGDNDVFAQCRWQGGSNEACYEADRYGDAGSGRYYINEWDNSFGHTTLAQTGTGGALTGPVKMTLEVEGTSLRLYCDEGAGSETLRVSASDATLSGGAPGCGAYTAGAVTNARIVSHECGNLEEESSGGGNALPKIIQQMAVGTVVASEIKNRRHFLMAAGAAAIGVLK